MKMTQPQIEKYAKDFLKNQYNLELTVPIEINARLKRVLGRFRNMGANNRKPIKIEMSKQYLIHGKLEDIQSTIRHECTHYALYVTGKPYKDGEKLFESELKKHGTNSTRTTSLKLERNVNVYKCNCTTHTTLRALRNNGMNHTCSSCKSKLTYLGRQKKVV